MVHINISILLIFFFSLELDLRINTLIQQLQKKNPKLYVVFSGDAGSFLVRLSEGLKGHRCPEEWPQSLKAGDATKEAANK